MRIASGVDSQIASRSDSGPTPQGQTFALISRIPRPYAPTIPRNPCITYAVCVLPRTQPAQTCSKVLRAAGPGSTPGSRGEDERRHHRASPGRVPPGCPKDRASPVSLRPNARTPRKREASLRAGERTRTADPLFTSPILARCGAVWSPTIPIIPGDSAWGDSAAPMLSGVGDVCTLLAPGPRPSAAR